MVIFHRFLYVYQRVSKTSNVVSTGTLWELTSWQPARAWHGPGWHLFVVSVTYQVNIPGNIRNNQVNHQVNHLFIPCNSMYFPDMRWFSAMSLRSSVNLRCLWSWNNTSVIWYNTWTRLIIPTPQNPISWPLCLQMCIKNGPQRGWRFGPSFGSHNIQTSKRVGSQGHDSRTACDTMAGLEAMDNF
jgi:hypothetical protein